MNPTRKDKRVLVLADCCGAVAWEEGGLPSALRVEDRAQALVKLSVHERQGSVPAGPPL